MAEVIKSDSAKGPFRGLRAWLIAKDNHLTSLTSEKAEHWGKVMKAKCRILTIIAEHEIALPSQSVLFQGRPVPIHTIVPMLECACGLYAFKPMGHKSLNESFKMTTEQALYCTIMMREGEDEFDEVLRNMLTWNKQDEQGGWSFNTINYAFGNVNLWGKVLEFENGYRAQYAQIQEVLLPLGTPAEVIAGISQNYDCDVREMDVAVINDYATQHPQQLSAWSQYRSSPILMPAMPASISGTFLSLPSIRNITSNLMTTLQSTLIGQDPPSPEDEEADEDEE